MSTTRRQPPAESCSVRGATSIAALAILAGCAPKPGYEPRDGDIVFQTSRSAQSLAIQPPVAIFDAPDLFTVYEN